jgi:hypothetical protein
MDENSTIYAGMTINERLTEAGLFDHWLTAIGNSDRKAMSSMLISVDLTPDEAANTVDEVLRRTYFDDLRKSLDAMSLAKLGEEYEKQFGRPADLAIGAANLKELILTDRRLNPPKTGFQDLAATG